jgi:hypothetical protein
VEAKSDGSSLTISLAQESDAGEYICQVRYYDIPVLLLPVRIISLTISLAEDQMLRNTSARCDIMIHCYCQLA